MKTTYKMQLKVLTPIFIGSSEEYSRCDYVYMPQERAIYLLNKDKWIEFLIKTGLYDSFADNLKRFGSGFDIYRWLNQMQGMVKNIDFIKSVKEISEGVLSTKHIRDFRNHTINGFVKNAYREPYIPGSSIKGAVTTAILSAVLEKSDNKKYVDTLNRLIPQLRSHNDREARRLNNTILSDSFDYTVEYNNSDNDIKGMSGISISDSTPINKNFLKLYKKKDVIVINNEAKNKNDDRPIFRECVDEGAVTEFTLTIDRYKLKEDMGITDIESILESLKIPIERTFGDNGVLGVWNESKQYLHRETFDKGVLLLGGGVGYHSKTIIKSLFKDAKTTNKTTSQILDKMFPNKKHRLNNPLSPRALKVVTVGNKDVFMGLCKVEVIQQ